MCVVYRHAPSFLSSMTMPTGEQANPLQRLKEGPWRLAWAVGLRLNRVIQEDRTLDFLHDHNSMRIQKALQPDWTVESAAAALFTYVYNLRDNIVGLLDNSGNPVVECKYDAWGSC